MQPKGRWLIAVAISGVLTAVACHDEDVVGPKGKMPHLLADSRNQPFGQSDLQIPPNNSDPTYGALALTTTSISLPENQWVVLTVTGGVQLQMSSLCSTYPDCPATATHSGQTIDALGIWPFWLQVKLSGAGYDNIPLYYDDQNVPTALVWSGSGGVISASRGGDQDGVGCYSAWPDPNTGITGCPPPSGTLTSFFAYAYTMTGSQTLKAAVVDPLVVHGTPTTIHPGDSVTFTANLVSPIYKDGNTWTWVAGEVGNQQQNEITTDPPAGGVRIGCNASPCVYAPTQSGRMYVQSTDYYGHPLRGSSEYIALNAGNLQVVANPTSLAYGSSVTFTTSTTDGSTFSISSWSFQPDNATAGVTTPCAPGVNPCVTTVSHSGTMFVKALTGGVEQLATVHVSITSCPSGDSLFDSEFVRDSIAAEWQRTLSELPEKYRREQTAILVQQAGHPDVTRFIPLQVDSSDNCTSFWSLNGYPAGWYPVGFVHFHPQEPGSPVTFCKEQGGKMPPNLVLKEGPSEYDWAAADSLNNNPNLPHLPGMTDIPSYVIDKENLYKYMPNTPVALRDSSFTKHSFNPAVPSGCP